MKKFRINSEDSSQQLIDYINSVNKVSNLAQQVGATSLPALVTPPNNYGNFAEVLANAKVHTLSWNNEVLNSFNTIPELYISFNTLFQSQFHEIQEGLIQLKENPNNSTALNNIKSTINQLKDETNPGVKYFSDLQTWILNYGNSLQPFANQLNDLSQQITSAENVDQEMIAKLNDSYNNLNELVELENQILTLNKVGNLIFNIYLVAVGVAVGLPFNTLGSAIAGGIVGVAAAGYTTYDPVMTSPDFCEDLKNMQNEMSLITVEIGLMNTIVGQLQIISNQFQSLIDQCNSMGDSVNTIANFWSNLQNDLSNILNDLDQISVDITSPTNINDALLNILEAQNSWNDLQDFMNKIKDIKYVIPSDIVMPQTESATTLY